MENTVNQPTFAEMLKLRSILAAYQWRRAVVLTIWMRKSKRKIMIGFK